MIFHLQYKSHPIALHVDKAGIVSICLLDMFDALGIFSQSSTVKIAAKMKSMYGSSPFFKEEFRRRRNVVSTKFCHIDVVCDFLLNHLKKVKAKEMGVFLDEFIRIKHSRLIIKKSSKERGVNYEVLNDFIEQKRIKSIMDKLPKLSSINYSC